MPTLFISHAIQDRNIVTPLRRAFGHFGDQVFIAPEAIVPGEKGWISILNAIAQSNLFVLVATPASCASPSVQREVTEALRLGKKIIPLRFGMSHSELPTYIRAADFQSFDLRNGNETSRLFDYLGLMTGRGNFWKGAAVALTFVALLWLITRK